MNIPGTIVFVSAFYNRTGLAGSARAWVKTLHDGGARVRIISVNDTQPGVDDFDMTLFKSLEQTPLIQPITAIFFHNPTEDWLNVKLPEPHVRIMLTGFVGENVPPDWIDICNQMDQVCVMSNTERINWIQSGASTFKLSILPGPNPWLNLPVQSIPRKSSHLEGKKSFRILSLGTFSPNRRWDALIEAYLVEFRDHPDAELYLKVNYPAWHPIPNGPKNDLLELIKSLRIKTQSEATITIDEDLGTRMDIMGLLDSADLYISCDVAYTATSIEAICRYVPVAVVAKVYKDSPTILENAFRIESLSEHIEVKGNMLLYLPQYGGVSWPGLSLESIRAVLESAYSMGRAQLREKGKSAYYQTFGNVYNQNFIAQISAVVKRAWGSKNNSVCHGEFPTQRHELQVIGSGLNAMERDDMDIAVTNFEELLQDQPDLYIASRLLAESLMQSEKYSEALDLLSDTIQRIPDHAELHCLLGEAAVKNGDSALARDMFQKALALEPGSPLPYLHMVELLIDSGDFNEALVLCDNALKVAPNNIDLRALMGLVFVGLDKPGGAIKTWQSLPYESMPKRRLIKQLFATLTQADHVMLSSRDILDYADSLYVEHELELAIELIRGVIAADPTIENISDLYYQLMILYHGCGKSEEARDMIASGLDADPNHAKLNVAAIRERINDWNYSDALDDIGKAIKQNPRSAELLILRGNCLLDLEKYSQAYEAFKSAYEEQPNTVGLLYTLNHLAPIIGKQPITPPKKQEEKHKMTKSSIYTKDALAEYITKLGFKVGDYSYGAPIIRWWGEEAKLQIGRYCSFAANVKIYLGGNHRHDWITTYPFPSDPMNENWPNVKNRGLPKLPVSNGDVKIGDDVWIGDDVSILSGLTIGVGAVIAAKAMITKDVPPYAIMGGNPARVISYRFPEETIQALLESKWWTWSPEKVNAYLPLLCSTDTEAFLEAVRSGQIPEVLAPLAAPDEPKFTGERAMPLAPNMDDAIMVEHWARYKHVAPLVKGLRVLDIACGAGYGSDYLADYAKTVVGGDIDPETVEYCNTRYQKDNLGYEIMDIRDIPYPDNTFDAIVSFETIEHVEEWEQFLIEINRTVVEDGQLIISTPLGGPCGNHFHLSYFQRGDFKKHLQKYFKDVVVSYQRVEKFHKESISPVYAETFTGEYALAVCKKPIKQARPLVSIIMLTYNALEYTQKCVDSLLEHTSYPYELIFVDNASSDGTVKYLQGLVKKHKRFKLIKNKANTGFAAGNNRGVETAVGEYVMLLNNDVLVADNWLGNLVAAFELDGQIGMVGPITNYISGRQMVNDVPYTDDLGYYAFADSVAKQYAGRITPRRRIAGFAVLMSKALYEQVDGFDESFGIGNYEDDDLCLKVRATGFAIMVHEGVFLHHYGSQSFKANKIDYEKSLEEKGKAFKNKWPDVDYEQLLELREPLTETHPIQYQEAYTALESGNFEVAFQGFSTLINEDPTHERAIEGLVLAARAQNNIELSLELIQKLLGLNPNNAVAYNLSGLMAGEAGNLEVAQRLFATAIEKDSNYVDAQRNLAEVLLAQDHFDQGVQLLLSILNNYPEDVPTLLRLAELNLEAERNEDALELIKKVLGIVPDHPVAVQLLETVEKV